MVYFLIFLFLEVMTTSSFANSIGGLNIFFEIIFSALIGFSIFKNFKFSFMESIEKARTGQMTQQEFMRENVSRATGALLLIIPGFFSDILGILMLVGILPYLITKLFQTKDIARDGDNYFNNQTHFNNTTFNNTTYKKGVIDDEIIDIEIIDDDKPSR